MGDFEETGRAWVRSGISRAALSPATGLAWSGPGARLSLDTLPRLIDEVTGLAQSLVKGARAVRLLAFDKTESNNWTLPWHQDRVVALQDRAEAPGFINWTRKDGVWHAEPPAAFLDRMLFARVHIDPATIDNGCLQVALGTHKRGKIGVSEAEVIASAAKVEDCVADSGDILFARALILHRSSPSRAVNNRRALRIDFSADPLPAPLRWAA